jgi:putative transposase
VATDATESSTDSDGRCAVFVIIDHACGEVWVDAAPRMDRWAAADLLREACTERFGSVEAAVADGLALRHDGGSVLSLRPLPSRGSTTRISRSPAFHYEPETNGWVEKFIQTLKEQILWIERFETLAGLRAAIRAFAQRYNREWLLEAHDYRTPLEARRHLIGHATLA